MTTRADIWIKVVVFWLLEEEEEEEEEGVTPLDTMAFAYNYSLRSAYVYIRPRKKEGSSSSCCCCCCLFKVYNSTSVV